MSYNWQYVCISGTTDIDPDQIKKLTGEMKGADCSRASRFWPLFEQALANGEVIKAAKPADHPYYAYDEVNNVYNEDTDAADKVAAIEGQEKLNNTDKRMARVAEDLYKEIHMGIPISDEDKAIIEALITERDIERAKVKKVKDK